jgi:hypothetical protein
MRLMPANGFRRTGLVACLVVLAAACASRTGEPPAASAGPPAPTQDAASSVVDAVLPAARAVVGSGEPRSSGYWIAWSSCGVDNRAETAAANGGREAGWFIVDDLLSDPGIVLGDHAVTACDEAVDILDTSRTDPISTLARQLLTAALNRAAGSEACESADDTIAVAGQLLTSLDYRGPNGAPAELEQDVVASIARVGELLASYNSGELCR